MPLSHIQNFSSGQLDKLLLGRYDLEAYQQGALSLHNAQVMEEGGATRRQGSYFLGEAKYSDRHTRLKSFYFNRKDFCMLEIGHHYIRFWNSFGLIKDNNIIVEVDTPYDSSEVFYIDIKQTGNKVFFAHKNHPLCELKRIKDNYIDWRFQQVSFEYPVTKDINSDNISLAPKVASKHTTIIANAPLFESKDEGTKWVLEQWNEHGILTQDDLGGGTTPKLRVEGEYSFVTHGKWDGKVQIEKSLDNGNTWDVVRVFASKEDYNVDFTGNEPYKDVFYRVRCPNGIPKNLEFEFEIYEKYTKIVFEINHVEDDKHAHVTAQNRSFVSTKDSQYFWEPAFNSQEGYPTNVEMYEQRLVLCKDNQIWMSRTDDWYNFKTGSKATDAISLMVPTTSKIEWILTSEDFIIGATDKQFTLGQRGRQSSLSPESLPRVKVQSNNGSSSIHAQLFQNNIIFVQSHYQKINTMEYNWQEQTYKTPELTLMSKNITGNGVSDMTFAYDPQPILWATRDDGNVIGLTYNRDQKISAWHVHDFGGKTQCVETLPLGFANEDVLWRIERRFINGQYKMYIERETQKSWEKADDAIFLDSALNNGGYDYIDFSKVHFKNDYTIKVETDTDLTKHLSEGDTIKLYQPNYSLDETVIGDIKIIDNYHLEGKTASRKIEKQTGKLSRVAKTFSGLEHLEGCTVQGWADGYVPHEMLVNNGQVTLDIYARQVYIGLPYKTEISPMPIAVNTSSGSTMPRPLKLTKVFVRFYNTTGADFYLNDKKQEIYWRKTTDDFNKWAITHNKLIELPLGSGYDRMMFYKFIQDKPAPMTVLSISNVFEVMEA